MASEQDATFQLKTALIFIDMAGDEKYSDRERKPFFRMAFMHAKVCATMADCLGLTQLSFQADSVASDCGCALDKLLDGATIEQGREEYFKAKIRRSALDRAMGLPQDFIR
jgi:hypothetical protein